jgi:hypothetical protein
VVLGGCLMTHMDDQIANHIKGIIRRATRKPREAQEQPKRPDTLNQVVRILRRGHDQPLNVDQPSMQRLTQRDRE